MPWIKRNPDEDPIYVVSKYTKEDLPTWDELYNEFYLKKNFTFKPSKDTEMDPYWNIPKQKYLLAVVCNQFNKMIFEDGYKEKIKETWKSFESMKDIELEDIRCAISPRADIIREGSDEDPAIYTLTMPNGRTNPFITSSHPRIIVDKIYHMDLFFAVIVRHSDSIFREPLSINTDHELMIPIIDTLMKDVKTYFEGEGIGWKDSNGNLLDKENSPTKCNGAGFDPAL